MESSSTILTYWYVNIFGWCMFHRIFHDASICSCNETTSNITLMSRYRWLHTVQYVTPNTIIPSQQQTLDKNMPPGPKITYMIWDRQWWVVVGVSGAQPTGPYYVGPLCGSNFDLIEADGRLRLLIWPGKVKPLWWLTGVMVRSGSLDLGTNQ